MWTDTMTKTEIWEDVNMDVFRELYEISQYGRVRSKPYRFYKNGELHKSESRLLENYDKQVFLTNGVFRSLFKIGVLFNRTFKDVKEAA